MQDWKQQLEQFKQKPSGRKKPVEQRTEKGRPESSRQGTGKQRTKNRKPMLARRTISFLFMIKYIHTPRIS